MSNNPIDALTSAPPGHAIVALSPEDAALLTQARAEKAKQDAVAAEAAQRDAAQRAAEQAAEQAAAAHLAEYERLNESNPFAAAQFYFAFAPFVDAARTARKAAKR